MTPDTAAVSLRGRLGLIPPESDAAHNIRHSERECIPAGEFGEFESLPESAQEVEQCLSLPPSVGSRLMRALLELGLVWRDDTDVWYPTERGAYLRRAHPHSLADAVNFGAHVSRLDAGGGSGALAFALLRAGLQLTATVMDLPDAVAVIPQELQGRCVFVPADFFSPGQSGMRAI